MRVGAWPLGLLLFLVVFAGLPGSAEAHALLRRAMPPTGQTLSTAPTEVRLLFSEPLDPTFSRVRVMDSLGRAVDNGDARVDPTDEYELVATLPDGLPNGVYTVDWRSLSTIDVHPDFGRYPLFVGVPVAAATQSTSFSESGSGPATAVARWAFYLTVSLFGGAIVTWKLVFSPLLVGGYAAARSVAVQQAHRGIVLGGLLLVLATAFAAVAQASAAAGVPLLSGIGPPLADLLGRGRFAAIWWPRFLLELMSLGLIAFGGLEGLAADMAVAMVPAILLTSSLTSHGAALPGVPGAGTVLDWLHLVSGVVWIGGLASLVVVLPRAVRRLPSDAGLVRAAVGRFSRLALLAACVAAVSGSVQAALELGSLSALTGTAYGQVVLLKVGLLVAMLALALLNQRRAAVIAWFRQGVRLELLVGAAVLAAAAVLTGIPPAR
jgi:copper transport protein